MKVIHPLTVNSELQNAYLRYVDTTYWLRHPDLMKERREILKQYGRLFTEFHLEPIAQYDATIDLLDFASKNGVPDRAAAIVGESLFRQFTPEVNRLKFANTKLNLLHLTLYLGLVMEEMQSLLLEQDQERRSLFCCQF